MPDPLLPYVPRLLAAWPADLPAPAVREIEGSLAFVDISGFTAMSERLARSGKVGAEEVAAVIDSCFTSLLGVAYGEDGSLLKFGGDALLLHFTGDDHQARAARSAARMRRTLREIGKLRSSAGNVSLRMSVGIHAGTLHLFLVGTSHHELVVCGPMATRTVEMESAASAGEILLSPELARALSPADLGAERSPGILLGRTPGGAAPPAGARDGFRPVTMAVPTAIREHILAGGDQPEHRLVSVAFIHVRGVDPRIAEAGSEKVRDELHDLIGAIQHAADTHGVTFLGTDIAADGTKIILTAGAPAARGDDEGRLLRAARVAVQHESPFDVRAGVNRGHVFAGDIGPPYRRTYTVMGDAVNLAARVMQQAADGEVLTTPEVADRSRTRFETEPVEPFRVKGKAEPVEAVRVGGLLGGRASGGEGETSFVGREAELGILLAALADARDGKARIVEVVGEPGMGKTRLLGELVSLAESTRILRAACDPYETSTPYHPFRDVLRELLQIPEGATEDQAISRFRLAVTEAAPDLEPWLPLIAAPLGLHLSPTAETASLEERFRRERLQSGILRLIGALVTGPALLIVEDAHWIDDASAELLGSLDADSMPPWLIVVTRREDGARLTLDGSMTTELNLEPLPLTASEALLAAVTDDEPLRGHDVEELVRRAGGNPLFLRELVSSARSAEGSLPETLEGAIAARIDDLPPRDRAVLRRLAVLGPVVDRGIAAAVLPADCGPDPIAKLTAFLEPVDPSTVRFKHALIRDTAYHGLPFRLRAELHGQVAETIERAAFPDVDTYAEVLALHFSEAARHGSAWIYSRVAARRAQEMYANVEAARFYERALDSARHLDTVSAEAAAELWEALGDVRDRMGEFAKATLAFRAARGLRRDDPVAVAQLMLKEASVARRAGRFADALRWITKGRGALEGAPDTTASRERARLSAWYASIRQEQGRSREAIRWATRAIEEAERSGARDVLAHASYILDWAYVLEGRLDLACNSERALQIYEEIGDLPGQANVLNNLGGFAYERGRWDEALSYYERSREAREKTGDAVNAAFGTINVGEILADQGRLERAEDRIREALRVWRASGYRSGVGYALMLLGKVVARAGRHAEALEHLEQARAEFDYIGAAGDLIAVDAREAEVRLLMGEHEAAAALAEGALTRAGKVKPAQVFEPLLLRCLGYARLMAGDAAAARETLEASLSSGRGREADYEVAMTLRALSDLARLEGEGERADALEAESLPILERAGVVSIPDMPLPSYL